MFIIHFYSFSDGKKLCRILKASPETYMLHHYKDGKFNRVYDRKETVKSLVRFMNDPTGDVPWEEEPSGKSVVHLPDIAVSYNFGSNNNRHYIIQNG